MLAESAKGRTWTLAQIGEVMEISAERVRQIEVEALGKLRQFLEDKNIDLRQ